MRLIKTFAPAIALSLALSLLPYTDVTAAERLQPVDGTPVIVIDPGHGGDNMGSQAGGIWDEKYMTMITAQAMYDELCLYDDVEVYLTRTNDSSVSFAERAEFAQSVGADFLFSIHYNASENHEQFGSEVWVPLTAPFNNYGYQVACELLSGMRERDLFIRGVKTRQGERGEYYAIIREPYALGIPAIIIEHCHVDHPQDQDYCDSEEDLIRFGREDATAVAKYFGLKSSTLNVDYSNYQLAEVGETAPVPSTLQDTTEPDVCRLELSEENYEDGYLSFTVSAADYDTPLLYYSYSIDGGLTYSPMTAWPGSDALAGSYTDTFTLSLAIPDGIKPSVILRAYNKFNLYTESNRYDCPKTFASASAASDAPEESETARSESNMESGMAEQTEPSAPEDNGAEPVSGDAVEVGTKEISFGTFLKICLAFVTFLFVLLLISQAITSHRRKRHRNHRKNDFGRSRNQHR